MRRLDISPRVDLFEQNKIAVNTWFRTAGERLNVYSGTADPALSEVPENQWIVYYNTTLGELRIWTNIAGTLKKSAAFT